VGTERVPRGFFATVVTGAEEETERDEMVSSGGGNKMGLGLDWRRRWEQLRLLPFVRVSVVAVARGGTCRSVSVWPLGIFLGGWSI
jgi:hypothetical protein